jgi:hypothetical protein
MNLARRRIILTSYSLQQPSRRTFFSGINKFLDDKLPAEASSNCSQPTLMVLPVLLTHGVLGSLLSYPVLGEALMREQGVLGVAVDDWNIVETSLPLSLGFMLSGMVSSFFGGAIAAMGPRKALLGSAVCIGSGLALSAVGVYTHTLPLLYFGFGASTGAGVGLAYSSPVQTLMTWYPHNKGVCGGVAVSALGLGAVLSREGLEGLLKMSASLPYYLGPSSSFEVLGRGTESLLVEVEGVQTSVVEVLSGQVNQLVCDTSSGLGLVHEGLYLAGTGSTGAAQTLTVMSVVSFTALAASAMIIRPPPKEYTEEKHDLLSPLFTQLTDRESKVSVVAEEDAASEVDFFTALK